MLFCIVLYLYNIRFTLSHLQDLHIEYMRRRSYVTEYYKSITQCNRHTHRVHRVHLVEHEKRPYSAITYQYTTLFLIVFLADKVTSWWLEFKYKCIVRVNFSPDIFLLNLISGQTLLSRTSCLMSQNSHHKFNLHNFALVFAIDIYIYIYISFVCGLPAVVVMIRF